MKVFISWSGVRSQTLAQTLRDWMPLVLHYVEPWLSEADVAAGERWAQAVAKELEACNFGIICVTRENVGSPWVLFEAGSLAKSLQGSRVIPLLLDLEFSEIGGPLAQFQAKKADRDGISEVVQSLNHAAQQPVPEPREKQLFDALWPQLEGQLAQIPKQPASAKPIRPHHEVLEELVSGVRSLEVRFKNLEESVTSDPSRLPRSRRFRRFHPMMIHDFAHVATGKPGDPIALLMFASLFKDDLPWLYEIGLETYRVARAGRSPEAAIAVRRFRKVMEFALRGPFSEELGVHPKEFHMLFRELEELLMSDGAMEQDKTADSPPSQLEQERKAD
jgi:hypothetical protein